MTVEVSRLTSWPARSSAVPRRIALAAFAGWGLLHVVGGAALLYTIAADGRRAGFESMGSAAAAGDIPLDPGPVAESVLAFHSLNILLAGIAVTLIAVTVARTAWPRGVTASLVIIAALDAGLLLFLVFPGHMKASEALWGPLLLVIAVPAAWMAGWRPRQL